MALGSILGEIGLSEQLVLSYIIGIAGAPAVHPYVQSLVNEAWASNSVLPPPAVVIAQGVAQGKVPLADGQGWANAQGFSDTAFGALVDTANVGMELGNAFQSWRRGDLTDGQFRTQLHRLGIDSAWWPMLEALKTDRLDLGATATAVHRGIMQDAGLLVTPVPTGSGNVPRIPVSTLDTLAEFAAQGIDPERARVLVADTGLPLALGEMLALYNRGEVTAIDVMVSIAESNVRNEYMDVALKLARRLLTPHEYAESELRGVKTRAEAEAGANLSGLEPDDYATLFEIMGRPLNVHEITTGLARGGTFGGTYDDVPEPYRDAIRRSAIRPEYAVLAHANRFSYNVPFWWRALATGNAFGTLDPLQLLLDLGNEPAFAKAIVGHFVGTATATVDPHVKAEQTRLRTAAHGSYVKGEIGAADATAALPTAGVDAAAVPAVLAVWDAERALIRKQLSVSQIQKALKKGLVNPATGVVWTVADATAAFLERGYSADDAATLIAED